jgi:UPF0755 protein
MKIFALSLLFLLILIAGYELYLILIPRMIEEVLVEIKQGESAASIADKLVQNRVIRSKWPFIILVRLRGIEKDLSWGKYLFSGNLSTTSVIDRILEGKVELKRVTIPEGLTIRETAQTLSKQGFGQYENYLALSRDQEFAQKITNLPVQTLEGFLYPETYRFAEEVTEEYILRSLVNEFFTRTSELHFPEDFNYSLYETIILASIIEKEARFIDEKPLISSVFLNRLNIGMRLQADPTVAYILTKEGIRRRRIYYRDLEIDSPYNTYRYSGLPPAPICSPSLPAIKAVLEPAESDFLYFFADSQGRHIFSKTYREHIYKQRALRSSSG